MGRKPTRWLNLPNGMRARPRGLKIFYYLDTGERPRREIPLGSDYVQAVAKWAELTEKPAPVTAAPPTLKDALDGWGDVRGYRKDVMTSKAPRTRRGNEAEIVFLLRFFDDPPAPLDEIEPKHIRAYLRWRVGEAKAMAGAKNRERIEAGRPAVPVPADWGEVRANREIALFSHVWNYARAEGLTSQPNPCTGVKRYSEDGREVAPDDELIERVLAVADQPLRYAIRLAELTGQRPADVLRMSEQHVVGEIPGGELHVRQGKTKARLRIAIVGELAQLLTDMLAYKRHAVASRVGNVSPMALLVNEAGRALSKDMLRNRFDDARARAGVEKAEFQFRDLRAKAATDADDEGGTRQAQALLGHTTEGMTANYIRHKAGRRVMPIR